VSHFRDDEDRDELQKVGHAPFNHLTRLRAREYFTEFSRRESFKLCITVYDHVKDSLT
jgi:hypothetical protein